MSCSSILGFLGKVVGRVETHDTLDVDGTQGSLTLCGNAGPPVIRVSSSQVARYLTYEEPYHGVSCHWAKV